MAKRVYKQKKLKYNFGGLTKYATGSTVEPDWLKAVKEANERAAGEDAYIKGLGLDPNSLSPTERKKALLNYGTSKSSVALQKYAAQKAAQKAATVKEISQKFNIPAEVAERSLDYSQAAPASVGTISQDQIVPTKEEVQYNFSHPIEYFSGRPNNFDLLAGIPGYIATSAIPNTIYNFTGGLDETAGDLATGLEGLVGGLIYDKMSTDQLNALNRSTGRFFDAAAAAGVFRPSVKIPYNAVYDEVKLLPSGAAAEEGVVATRPTLGLPEAPTYENVPAVYNEQTYRLNAAPKIQYLTEGKPVIQTLAKATPRAVEYSPANDLEIKSIAEGSPLEKSLNKNGEISIATLKAYINSASVPKADKHYLELALNKHFPNQKNINYNEFRNAVSEELAPLEMEVYDSQFNNYGTNKIGYFGDSEALTKRIKLATEELERRKQDYQLALDTYKNIDPSHPKYKQNIDYLNWLKDEIKRQEDYLDQYKNTSPVIENKTLLYSGKQGLSDVGSNEHFRDRPNTLLHTRYMITDKEPNVFHSLEQQSDYMQKDVNELEKTAEPKVYVSPGYDVNLSELEKEYEIVNEQLANLDNIQNPLDREAREYAYNLYKNNIESKINELKNQAPVTDNSKKMELIDKKVDIDQLNHLKNKHLERLLQENVKFANSKGLTKYRYPTPETAAKIQYYPKVDIQKALDKVVEDLDPTLNNNVNYLLSSDKDLINDAPPITPEILEHIKSNEPQLINDLLQLAGDRSTMRRNYLKDQQLKKRYEDLLNKGVKEAYSSEHETILKKYADYPKMVKKLYGIEPTVVTDNNGNTWYEFDIPEVIKKTKGKTRAFKYGGWLTKYQNAGEVDLDAELKKWKAEHGQSNYSGPSILSSQSSGPMVIAAPAQVQAVQSVATKPAPKAAAIQRPALKTIPKKEVVQEAPAPTQEEGYSGGWLPEVKIQGIQPAVEQAVHSPQFQMVTGHKMTGTFPTARSPFVDNKTAAEILERQRQSVSKSGNFLKLMEGSLKDPTLLNRTGTNRLKDTEKFMQDLLTKSKSKFLIIDIGSALGNPEVDLQGVSVNELLANPVIKKQATVVATDIPSEYKNFKNINHINAEEVPLSFNTPVGQIIKKYGDQQNIILRSANSIDKLMNDQQTIEHLNSIIDQTEGKNVFYIFNKDVLYKPYNGYAFKKIAEIDNAGFNGNFPEWNTRLDRIPFDYTDTDFDYTNTNRTFEYKHGGWLNQYKSLEKYQKAGKVDYDVALKQWKADHNQPAYTGSSIITSQVSKTPQNVTISSPEPMVITNPVQVQTTQGNTKKPAVVKLSPEEYDKMVYHQIDKILAYEQERGGPGGKPLPYYSDPKYKKMLIEGVYPEAKKLLPNASPLELGEAMDFIFNTGWDQQNNRVKKDPRAYAIQEYYRKYDPTQLDKDQLWAGRKGAPYSFDEIYNNTLGKLDENERRQLMNKGRDWYYQNINNPSPGVPSDDYYGTWYGRIWNMNDTNDYVPNNPKFIYPKKKLGGWLNNYK